MSTIKSYQDLIVWQKAMALAEQIYLLAQRWPREELYGLTAQIKRAVASVPANIAEGHARSSTREHAHFLSIAHGSLTETETFLRLAIRLNYLTPEDTEPGFATIVEVGKMLNVLRARLAARERQSGARVS